MRASRKIVIGIAIVALATLGYWQYQTRASSVAYKTSFEKDTHVRFSMEIFDRVVESYWQKVNVPELAELYRLALARVASTTEVSLPSSTREGVAEMLAHRLEDISEVERNELALNTNIIVLANLAPQGRSGLLSEKQEVAFRDDVNNINRERNLYESLGLGDGADVESVEKAYEEKKQELAGDTTPEAQTKLQEIAYAREVLTDEGSKAIYDTTKSEPTLDSGVEKGGSLYLDLSKISNTTLQEIANKLSGYTDENPPQGLIIDLRSNAGGALDFAKYFLSFFLGPNQHAYDLFHQGEYDAERTPAIAKVGYLSKLDNIAVLTDGASQSTAELLSATFKRLRLGKVVGETTKGWGTVEDTFPLETDLGDGNKYSVLLVHSITLRDDGEPIEGRGVEPDIDISKQGWQTDLNKTFRSQAFVNDIQSVLKR